MQIESIEIKNYRLFRSIKITQIPRLCVLVGANGSGKSTLFDVFSFLKDALSMNVAKAIAKRGGYRELASRGYTGEPIEITFQFRLEITGRERLVTYVLKIETDAQGKVVVARSGQPVARLAPCAPRTTPRIPGRCASKIVLVGDFNAPPPDNMLDAFER